MQANRLSNNGDILGLKLWQSVTVVVNRWLATWRFWFCYQVQNDEVFSSLLFQVLSPLWYIFDHSQIPCGVLDTHFPGVKPSSTDTVSSTHPRMSECAQLCGFVCWYVCGGRFPNSRGVWLAKVANNRSDKRWESLHSAGVNCLWDLSLICETEACNLNDWLSLVFSGA